MIPAFLIPAVAFARRVPRLLSRKGWLWLGLILAALVLALWLYNAGGDAVREDVAADQVKAVQVNAGAIEKAGVEHMNDERAIDAREKDRNDATAALPDARPSDRRLALACERLRQQGTDPAGVAACGRLAGRGEAPAGSGGPR